VLHTIVTIALLLHGLGHAAGFWTAAPTWFGAAWLVPGIGFLVGSWAFWQGAEWASLAILASAVLSMLLILLSEALTPGPIASAFAFNLALVLTLLVPWSRRLLLGV
jgi:hypothetical protein